MRSILMMLGCDAAQAAARAPLYSFVCMMAVVLSVAAWLCEMDYEGKLDALGAWMGRKLREVLNAVSDR